MPSQTTLPSDAYYQGPPPCAEPGPVECEFELAFCTDGTYTLLLGDDGTVGMYRVDDGVAIDDDSGFEFDFTTQRITAGPNVGDGGSDNAAVACAEGTVTDEGALMSLLLAACGDPFRSSFRARGAVANPR